MTPAGAAAPCAAAPEPRDAGRGGSSLRGGAGPNGVPGASSSSSRTQSSAEASGREGTNLRFGACITLYESRGDLTFGATLFVQVYAI